MGIFRKASPAEPIAVTMTGVKLGYRVLVVGARDPKTAAQLAIRAGLTGRACLVDDDERRLASAASAIEKEGALAEAIAAPLGALPLEAGSFDLAVIPQLLGTLTPETRAGCLAEVFRVLRPGGRAIAIEATARGGFAALLKGRQHDAAYAGAAPIFRDAGFTAVRDLGEADGALYVEGIKRA